MWRRHRPPSLTTIGVGAVNLLGSVHSFHLRIGSGSGLSRPRPELTVSATLRSPRFQRHLDIDDRSQGTADVPRHRCDEDASLSRRSIHAAATGADEPIECLLLTAPSSRTRPRSGQSQSSIADVCGLTLSPHRPARAVIAGSSDRPPRVIARRVGIGVARLIA